ncbi:putative RNA-directed DNA polymerase [Lupinus albus]|uniref:Putative RNA-directed DNA polymerase n=1 Tax=Lupinus albus TaxID=3870 RepID=A0A6A4R7X9_LUPAL|nr:putative RNA-directed DNA polymerase [Lupinus albus]
MKMVRLDDTLYKQIVGSMRFLCNSKPDLSYGVGLVSRFMCNPKKSHTLAAKRLLRYVQGTTHYGVFFPVKRQEAELEMVGFADSDYSGDLVEGKSTSEYFN